MSLREWFFNLLKIALPISFSHHRSQFGILHPVLAKLLKTTLTQILCYIKNHDNEFPELAGKVQVDATIALTDSTFSMSFLAFIVPTGTLPNNFKGVLLG